jgi:hypothetical protein
MQSKIRALVHVTKVQTLTGNAPIIKKERQRFDILPLFGVEQHSRAGLPGGFGGGLQQDPILSLERAVENLVVG